MTHRPISILSYFSKLLEILCTFVCLYNYIEKKHILYYTNTSTDFNLAITLHSLYRYDNISANIDRGEYSLGIVVDVGKAFGTVNDLRLLKLDNMGIRWVALS